MKLLYLMLFALGLLTNVAANALSDQCALHTKEQQIGEYFQKLQFSTALLLMTLGSNTAEFCSQVPEFQHEIAQFRSDAELCLNKSEAYTVNISYNAVSEFLTFLCKSSGQNIDILLSDQTQQCKTRLKKSLKFDMCMEDLYDIIYGKKIPENLCRTVKIAEVCSKRILSEHCSEFSSLISLHRDFFEAIFKPCNGQTSNFIATNDV